MNLDETQRKKISDWVGEGLKLSEIQTRIASEWGLRMTYMDVRFLVDDLKLTLKDPERSDQVTLPAVAEPTNPSVAEPKSSESPTPPATVRVAVDQLTRPGAVVSGKVTFGDGNKADWYLDQSGRLGMVAKQEGYRPSATDVQQFQVALESELSKLGL